MRWEGRDWIYLAPDRDAWPALMNAVLYLRISQNKEKFLTF
jgi:hypothetical protein